MKKKVLIITTILLALASSTVSADARKNVVIDGQTVSFDQDPVLKNGVTLVQFTPVFKQLGISSTWDQQKKQVTGVKNGTKIILTVGNKKAYVNGNLVKLEVAPIIIEGKIFVPLRFVIESTGASMNVRNSGNVIDIYSNSNTSSSSNSVHTPAPAPTPTPTPVVITPKPITKPELVPSIVTNEQISTFLSKKYGTLTSTDLAYSVNYTVSNRDYLALAVHIGLDELRQTLEMSKYDRTHIYNLVEPVASDLHNTFNIEEMIIIIYLDFISPIYTESFGYKNISELPDGSYQVFAPIYTNSFNYKDGTSGSYILDLNDSTDLTLMYEKNL
ncbi:stalk domain-containing protein [Paenibacillus dakarensis]|uniref:stalk domain-containing protein n=1 Tax=Paenibacillus dakarensis TaxID=1527293 RepID=UPI0006D57CCE|nr:stalk domain-containing protein [Paenibacillus dakarensis]